jgi:spermidine synthase
MLELPNPFAGEGGVIRLLEPGDCDLEALVDRVLSGLYSKPFVIEVDGLRSLYFTRAFIQSEMRLADPHALQFAYTRKMMGFLLFLHEPRAILMLGLGGGSLAKYCHRHLGAAQILAVEIDPHIIAFRDQFLVPADDARFRVVEGDAAQYVAQCEVHYDAVMIDAFDRDGVAPSLCTREFYEAVRRLLPRKGVMVANLVGAKAERIAHLEMIRTVFGGNVILLPLADDGNYVAFAFRDPAFEPRWRWIDDQAKAMRVRYGLDFPKFAGKLERSRKLGYLRREMHQAQTRRGKPGLGEAPLSSSAGTRS